ncbi:hypothetical protein FRC19_009303 [Serendipita sp. 401]|nr:hypothetical protein FRC19_009303 [Serendipita sp. 401]
MSLGPVVVCKPFSQPYHDALKSKGFDPHFVQVLDTGFVNEQELRSVIEAGPKGKWSGVIVTSSRAAGAWISAAKAIPVDTESSSSQDGGGELSYSFLRKLGNGMSQMFGRIYRSTLSERQQRKR